MHRALSRSATIAAIAVATMLVAPTSALAAEGAPPTLQLVATIINFVLFIGLIWYFGRKPIAEYFRGRRSTIADTIQESKRLRDEAEARLVEYSKKLDAFDREREEILQQFRELGEAEKARIVAEAERQAAKIREDARSLAAAEVRREKSALQGRLVEQAVALATDEIARRMTPATQNRLIDRGIEGIRDLRESAAP